MANETGNSPSGPKRGRSSHSLYPEPNPVRSFFPLYSSIETVLRKEVRMQVDAEKACCSLLGQRTTTSGLSMKRIQAKGKNVEELQAKFDDIARGAERKFLEATIENPDAGVKDHLEEMRVASANSDGTFAR